MEGNAEWINERDERLKQLQKIVSEDNFGGDSRNLKLSEEMRICRDVKTDAETTFIEYLEKVISCQTLQVRIEKNKRLNEKQDKEIKRLMNRLSIESNRSKDLKNSIEIIEKATQTFRTVFTQMIVNHNNYIFGQNSLQQDQDNLSHLKAEVSKKVESIENSSMTKLNIPELRKKMLKNNIELMQLQTQKLDTLHMISTFKKINTMQQNLKMIKFASNMIEIKKFREKFQSLVTEQKDLNLIILNLKKRLQCLSSDECDIDSYDKSTPNCLESDVVIIDKGIPEKTSAIFDKFNLPTLIVTPMRNADYLNNQAAVVEKDIPSLYYQKNIVDKSANKESTASLKLNNLANNNTKEAFTPAQLQTQTLDRQNAKPQVVTELTTNKEDKSQSAELLKRRKTLNTADENLDQNKKTIIQVISDTTYQDNVVVSQYFTKQKIITNDSLNKKSDTALGNKSFTQPHNMAKPQKRLGPSQRNVASQSNKKPKRIDNMQFVKPIISEPLKQTEINKSGFKNPDKKTQGNNKTIKSVHFSEQISQDISEKQPQLSKRKENAFESEKLGISRRNNEAQMQTQTHSNQIFGTKDLQRDANDAGFSNKSAFENSFLDGFNTTSESDREDTNDNLSFGHFKCNISEESSKSKNSNDFNFITDNVSKPSSTDYTDLFGLF